MTETMVVRQEGVGIAINQNAFLIRNRLNNHFKDEQKSARTRRQCFLSLVPNGIAKSEESQSIT
jgi:hypothetical protein